MSLVIRSAQPADAALVHDFVVKLAEYEQLGDAVTATVEDLAHALFGATPRVFCDIAERDGEAVGFGLWYYTYSTFQGRAGIHLEDLYVEPEARRAGVGEALLLRLARRCVEEGLGRLNWSVLEWNKPALEFYAGLGARLTDEWIGCRLEGEALQRLGAEG